MDFSNILKAHALARQTAIIWGSSGYGKSSLVYAFAKDHGFEVVEKRTSYVDPLGVNLPHKNEAKGQVDFLPAAWIKRLRETTVPTVLFLDEFNRPESAQTFAIMTELLLDRAIDGIKLSDTVLIVAACNFNEEDVGTVEIPDAVMKRATHLIHAPSKEEICTHLSSELARHVVPSVAQQLIDSPAVHPVLDRLNGNPRQIDACFSLLATEVLSDAEFAMICRGRLGIEKGNLLATTVKLHKEKQQFKMPNTLTEEAFTTLKKLTEEGYTLEVTAFLLSFVKDKPKLVAEYLISYASPEVCRSLVQHGFEFVEEKAGTKMDWRGYAMQAGKLHPKAVA